MKCKDNKTINNSSGNNGNGVRLLMGMILRRYDDHWYQFEEDTEDEYFERKRTMMLMMKMLRGRGRY